MNPTANQDDEEQNHEEWLDQFRDENGEFQFCERCGETPCAFAPIADAVLNLARNQYEPGAVSNAIIRMTCYKTFTFMKYGHLGKGYRIEIPACVLEVIRMNCLETAEEYMGRKET